MTDLPPDVVLPGRYQHYKGKPYVVLGVARHSETEQPFVVYRTDYGDRSLWIRPLSMFLEQVVVEGRSIPRFQWIGPEEPSNPDRSSTACLPADPGE